MMRITTDQPQHQSEAAAGTMMPRSLWRWNSARRSGSWREHPGSEKISKRAIPAWGVDTLLGVLKRWRAQAAKRVGGPVKVVVIQEAGRDGFSVHRLLEERVSGMEAGLSIRPRSPLTAASGG
jgi:hypothetical protein